MSELDIREEPYDGPSAQLLTAEVQQEYVSRYGSPDDAPIDPAQFAPPGGCFVVGYLDVEPVAMGGFRSLEEGVVEIKRMFVVPAHRGRGFSRLVLGRLEGLAEAMGAHRVVLETGMKQPEAMALYASAGYDRIEGFGHYRDSPLSASYGKSLSRRS
ncbi:MAG TPA: GNAT family N-acetyltransferase [Mycobacteriales bacterium]|nr:GNAT family N-acetyltransferase [Mycobacteriales bacterium]